MNSVGSSWLASRTTSRETAFGLRQMNCGLPIVRRDSLASLELDCVGGPERDCGTMDVSQLFSQALLLAFDLPACLKTRTSATGSIW